MKIFNLEVMVYFNSPSKNLCIKIKCELGTIKKVRSFSNIHHFMDEEIERQRNVCFAQGYSINKGKT